MDSAQQLAKTLLYGIGERVSARRKSSRSAPLGRQSHAKERVGCGGEVEEVVQ